eukprot:365034-Chlamydomonas_euryale.AAC.2
MAMEPGRAGFRSLADTAMAEVHARPPSMCGDGKGVAAWRHSFSRVPRGRGQVKDRCGSMAASFQ